ncbi:MULTISPECIES: hypothetical protein [Aeribacillus]|jgi:hypothetical protein|uniref:Uncharacterized protein n=1 Tax=Aeribacillus pallidus TaxID=33936 RepID=A0A165YVA8_9BACI|nr:MULTISPECIES: hypothetical protein [Aeribacillus]KZN97486.1 hypothetical protein AZI98_03515 [Aeribacillus pallidus]MED0715603.1 hypothetical protein [Aeribacillus composti]MED0745313.1 hypothetical protein [Aeribacillus composti]
MPLIDNGRIKYFETLTDFLTEIDYLKIYHFEFREQEKILSVILDYLEEFRENDASIESAMFDFFTNGTFESDYFEGWGTDYYINNTTDLEIDEDENVLEQEDIFIIPIRFVSEIGYVVETKNPVYEPGDEDEFIQSETIWDDFQVHCKVVFNAINNEVE